MPLIYILRTRFSPEARRALMSSALPKLASEPSPEEGRGHPPANDPKEGKPRKTVEWRPLLPIVVPFLLFVTSGLVNIYLDPFGFAEATARHAQDTIMRAYFGPGHGDPPNYESKVAVALLKNNTAREFERFEGRLGAINKELAETSDGDPRQSPGEDRPEAEGTSDLPVMSWPLSMSMHARLLDAILLYKPKAIFLDILFLDRRDDDIEVLRDFLMRNIERTGWPDTDTAKKPGPHIYFARSADQPGTGVDHVIRPDLYDFDCTRDPACQEKSALLQAYLHQHLIPVPKEPEKGIIRSYAVEVELTTTEGSEAAGAAPPGGDKTKSAGTSFLPAFALLDRLDIEGAWKPSEKRWGGESWPNLEIVWATRPHHINKRWMRCKCFDGDRECLKYNKRNNGSAGHDETISNSLVLRLLTAFFAPGALQQTCAPIATVPFQSLLNWGVDPDIEAIVEDKVVFYGADITAAADLIYPPTHDRLAGVYMHAMAMDNLLTYGPDYLHRSGRSKEFDAIAIVVLGFLYLGLRRYEQKKRLQARGRLLLAFIYAGSSVALVVIYVVALTGLFAIAPMDWFGTLAFAFGVTPTWSFKTNPPAR